MMKLTLGADIGGTNTCIGAVSPKGSVLHKTSFSTSDYDDGTAYALRLATAIKKVMADAEEALGHCQWTGLGIGAPNGNYLNGCIEKPPNLRFKGVTPLVELLEKELELPTIKLTNDANAAAIGEKIYGAAKDYDDFIMVTLGTGLGSGIFVNGQLVYGHDGFAGELGHVSVIPDGRYDNFGRRGSLENYCSATGIRRTFFEMLAHRGGSTSLDQLQISEITSKHIADAAYAGDPVCEATMHFTGKMLGETLASAALITAPAAFFLFGGPVQAGSILIDTTREYFEKHLIPVYKNKIQIIKSALPPGDAAILGAAALVQ
ncbi:ROK family protein [Coraliomargarita akajimensis]|uniref:ROK family protein n=1 Tax=Coraliomargarita akajimensis (strain DSM 45221 / IAM 15411 / JCM 23193 / KCTC 12865 / 04OKA010-24) TaxID=583355 RepID=D5EJZ1_CORAD|nr:ROK family protein [Coraliomargarita akajimensis]ADE54740.1 ROK family protein [Coraliomargarita akajimensis DSM 45221]